MVLEDGFAWNGERYTSLSTIAKTITGTSWNGWSFFGIKRPAATQRLRHPRQVQAAQARSEREGRLAA